MKKIKILCVLVFAAFAVTVLFTNNRLVSQVSSFTSGPPGGVTGAPGENSCTGCHTPEPLTGQFMINGPTTYVPGQTYQVQVQHATTDTSRKKWGFELTAVAGTAAAGTFANLTTDTQILSQNSRFYIEHTEAGTRPNTMNGSTWTFNWTAPATNMGAVTFYAAGNQANNDSSADGDQIYTTTSVSQLRPHEPFDFDADGKTDISVYRPGSTGTWYVQRSTAGFYGLEFGGGADKIIPADYDGDNKTDIAVYRPSEGMWYRFLSATESFTASPWGLATDVPAPGDYDGDGRDDIAIFRPSDGNWWLNRSTAGTLATQFGQDGDIPVVGDYDGDGTSDIGIFRPSNGVWFIRRSTAGDIGYQFGFGTDKVAHADYDGDRKTDIAVYRPSTGQWFISNSGSETYPIHQFGSATDIPVPGDYDGDGRSDVAIFRPSTGQWWLNRTTTGLTVIPFGQNGDRPTPNAFGN